MGWEGKSRPELFQGLRKGTPRHVAIWVLTLAGPTGYADPGEGAEVEEAN